MIIFFAYLIYCIQLQIVFTFDLLPFCFFFFFRFSVVLGMLVNFECCVSFGAYFVYVSFFMVCISVAIRIFRLHEMFEDNSGSMLFLNH